MVSKEYQGLEKGIEKLREFMEKSKVLYENNIIPGSNNSEIKPKENVEEQNINEEVILFFSFDIVNSSLYKTINYYRWSVVLSKLFDNIREKIQKSMVSAELWRLLGDEMIFIVSIKDEDDIFEYVNYIYSTLMSISKVLKDGSIFDELDIQEEERNLMKLQNILSLKAAAWIAIVNNIPNINNMDQYDNISAKYQTRTKYEISEFLGNDIDTGFRISKETCDRRLVISFELAYLLSKRSENLSNLFIITYKKLKGVWKDKLYPIIWYYDEKIEGGIKFEESFYYDELQECSLVKEYFNNRKEETDTLEKYMFVDKMRALNKILKDRNLEYKIKRIYTVIEDASDRINKYTSFSHLEFHCVAVCYDEENKKVLIVKRSNSKKSNPCKWEFGCAKAEKNEKMIDTIKKSYEDSFNIIVEPILSPNRKDKQPLPLALYEIEDDDGVHKGVITIAKLKSDPNDLQLLNKDKYSEFKWIDKEHIGDYCKDGINDFENTLNLVFNKMREYKGE